MKNRVFRCIEHRARGFVGLLVGELIAGFGAFMMMLAFGYPLAGSQSAPECSAPSAWRRRDADRSDYAAMTLRGLRMRTGHCSGASNSYASHRV